MIMWELSHRMYTDNMYDALHVGAFIVFLHFYSGENDSNYVDPILAIFLHVHTYISSGFY